jgi:small subunit ribosomal protein S13
VVRISGIDLSASKTVEYALTDIYGIGLTTARKIVEAAQIDKEKRMTDVGDTEISRIREVIESNYTVEDDLRRIVKQNIVRLSQVNCFKGRRHRDKLPLRGQRTRTNSRTARNSRGI